MSETKRMEFHNNEDACNYYLQTNAKLLAKIMECMEKTQNKYQCRKEIDDYTRNLFDFKREIIKNEQKLKEALIFSSLSPSSPTSSNIQNIEIMTRSTNNNNNITRHGEEDKLNRFLKEIQEHPTVKAFKDFSRDIVNKITGNNK
ncbi:hypothetical protein ABK040_014429 [Willaertia magna]